MTENKEWKKIDELFQTAVGLDEGDRERFLKEACGGDDRLFDEVGSLLESFRSGSSILDEPVLGLGLELLGRESVRDLTGLSVGHYSIRRKLGEGGMGEVYLADDTRLDRQVALKFLSDVVSGDADSMRQMIREARAAAMLDHPNICRVYGVDEIDARGLIVMEYVDGETLASALGNGGIEPGAVLPIIRQIAEALAAAHSGGIIHCDIKPGNIMLTKTGTIKVLDFGLAKVIRKTAGNGNKANISVVSRQGLIQGTVAYMSPEQLKGERLDFKSDVFSFGTLVFELVTGSNPFAQKSDAETIAMILSGRSPVEVWQGNRLPAELRAVIRKCIQFDKEKRYRSAEEVLLDLKSHQRSRGRSLMRSIPLFLLLVVIGLLAVSFYIYSNSNRVYRAAILPFANESSEPALDYVSDGISEGLIRKLSGSDRLQVRPFTMVAGYRGTATDQVEIGRALGTDLILSGKILRRNDRTIVQSNLFDSGRGIAIGSWEDELDPNDVLDFENLIAKRFLMAVPVNENDLSERKRRGSKTEDNEAFRQNWIGRYYWRKRDPQNLQLAIEAFRRSIDRDPGYSLPYSGLADCYVLQSLGAFGKATTREAMTKAKAAARQALEIDPLDAEAHTSLGIILTKYDWNWTSAEREFRQAIDSKPDYAAAHYWLSDLLADLGRTDESIQQAKLARELDPFSAQSTMNLARTYYYARQYDAAMAILSDAEPTDRVRYMIGLIDLQKGMYREALVVFQQIAVNNKRFAAAMLGYTYAKLGRIGDADKVIEDLISSSPRDEVPSQELAFIYIALGDNDKACSYLDAAYRDRHAVLIAVKVEPLFDPLREDARFIELLKMMSLT